MVGVDVRGITLFDIDSDSTADNSLDNLSPNSLRLLSHISDLVGLHDS